MAQSDYWLRAVASARRSKMVCGCAMCRAIRWRGQSATLTPSTSFCATRTCACPCSSTWPTSSSWCCSRSCWFSKSPKRRGTPYKRSWMHASRRRTILWWVRVRISAAVLLSLWMTLSCPFLVAFSPKTHADKNESFEVKSAFVIDLPALFLSILTV